MPAEVSQHESLPAGDSSATARPTWSERYGQRHRLDRVTAFPAGILGPKKVRIYRRQQHYVLQWWDPSARANLSDRVDGDLVEAVARARQVEGRLAESRSAGRVGRRRVGHAELVEAFLEDLRRRADAGDIDPATVRRYHSALTHYLAYSRQPGVARACPHAAGVNRDFRLGLAAFLAGRPVSPNGSSRGPVRPMKGSAFVLDTVRALYEWAGDPERGSLLPEGFRNPFLRSSHARALLKGDPLAEPDVTLAMAVNLVGACDAFQFRLLVPMLLFGLRASEPCFLFREYAAGDWLRVPNIPDLDYRTKGRRDKRFPLIDELALFWDWWRSGSSVGLLYERRLVAEGRESAPLRGAPLAELIAEFRRRCGQASHGATGRRRLRDHVLRETGGLTYDHVGHEFAAVARRLDWPKEATLKDLRHLFATTLGNAAMPEGYRRYLMGQAPGRAAVVAYTHLNQLRRHYAEAVRREWAILVEAVLRKIKDVSASDRMPERTDG